MVPANICAYEHDARCYLCLSKDFVLYITGSAHIHNVRFISLLYIQT